MILTHAATMEEERDHALDRPTSDENEASLWAEEEGCSRPRTAPRRPSGLEETSFEALESDAHFDHVLFDAQQFGLHAAVGSEEEQDYLGLPGLLEPEQVALLLHERQAKQSRAATSRGGAPAGAAGPVPVSAHRALASQRKELNKLVAAYSSKTGTPHASIHLDLRRACGGPELAAATSEQVTERIDRHPALVRRTAAADTHPPDVRAASGLASAVLTAGGRRPRRAARCGGRGGSRGRSPCWPAARGCRR